MSSNIDNRSNARELLRKAQVIVAPETFALISLTRENFGELLRSSDVSPVGLAPYFIFWDRQEVTLMLEQSDYLAVKNSASIFKVENGFRLLTFDVVMDFDVVGFLAEVSHILAGGGIPFIAMSAFSRDHILIKQNELGPALRVLHDHIADLC